MPSESGPLRFDNPYNTPPKAPLGVVAAAILTIIMGVYGIASFVYGTVISMQDTQVSVISMGPIAAAVLIYSGYAILKCRLSEYGRGLWLVILLSAIQGLFIAFGDYDSFPYVLINLFVLWRYGSYIAIVSTVTMLATCTAGTWIYAITRVKHVLLAWEFIGFIVPMLAILILLCLNWNTYKTCMAPKRKRGEQTI